MSKEYCCKRFAEHADREFNSNGGFEKREFSEMWNINGCCGGGCFVVRDVKFCPFCGTNLLDIEK
jgi:hypothetical protein